MPGGAPGALADIDPGMNVTALGAARPFFDAIIWSHVAYLGAG